MVEQLPQGKYYQFARYSGLGCTFAAAVLAFMAGGWMVDRWFGLTPVFMIVGALAGVALASVNLYQKLELGGRKRARGPRNGNSV